MKGKRTLRLTLAALTIGLVAAGAAQGGPKPAHYAFRGHLLATPTSATGITISVEGGNRLALRKMLGASVNQTFTVGPNTEFLKWTNGVPTVVQRSDLTAGDWLTVNVRGARNASLSEIESHPAGVIGDRGPNPNPPDQPLFLFRGKLTTSSSATTVALDVRGGNRNALRLLIGQGTQQSFAYGPETIFLLWQGKVPTVISASDLKVGDRVTVRIRAPRKSTLAQVESTPAIHVGDHEPAATKVTS